MVECLMLKTIRDEEDDDSVSVHDTAEGVRFNSDADGEKVLFLTNADCVYLYEWLGKRFMERRWGSSNIEKEQSNG